MQIKAKINLFQFSCHTLLYHHFCTTTKVSKFVNTICNCHQMMLQCNVTIQILVVQCFTFCQNNQIYDHLVYDNLWPNSDRHDACVTPQIGTLSLLTMVNGASCLVSPNVLAGGARCHCCGCRWRDERSSTGRNCCCSTAAAWGERQARPGSTTCVLVWPLGAQLLSSSDHYSIAQAEAVAPLLAPAIQKNCTCTSSTQWFFPLLNQWALWGATENRISTSVHKTVWCSQLRSLEWSEEYTSTNAMCNQ